MMVVWLLTHFAIEELSAPTNCFLCQIVEFQMERPSHVKRNMCECLGAVNAAL